MSDTLPPLFRIVLQETTIGGKINCYMEKIGFTIGGSIRCVVGLIVIWEKCIILLVGVMEDSHCFCYIVKLYYSIGGARPIYRAFLSG